MITPLGDGRDDTAALLAYFRANSPGRAELGPGRFLTTGLSLRGLSCAIVGCDDATTIAALPGQRGAVLDFSGYLPPNNMSRVRTIGGLAIEGDGTPGVEKRGILLGVDGDGLGGVCGMSFRDASVEKTGGCPLELGGSQLNHFERITLNTPVGCVANDVPYIRGTGPCNGNRLVGIGLRSITAGNDCPKGGAARFLGSPTNAYVPEFNVLDGWWVEHLHPSDGACVLAIQGNLNTVRDWMVFDVGKEAGATGTAFFRLLGSATHANYGGNTISGWIPSGHDAVDVGVEITQPGNCVVGVRGYGPGSHVRLGPQAKYTSIELAGCVAQPVADRCEVVDDSGRPTCGATSRVINAPGGVLDFGDGRRWTSDGLFNGPGKEWTPDGFYPGGGIKAPGCGTLVFGPGESMRLVAWEEDQRGNRRQEWIVRPLKGK